MLDLELKLKNFLSIKEAQLKSKNNITVLIAPNRAGKTQILMLLYAIFWSLHKHISGEYQKKGLKQNEMKKVLERKILNTFLGELMIWYHGVKKNRKSALVLNYLDAIYR
ncbi:AAA family ATPase [Persephonella sp.]